VHGASRSPTAVRNADGVMLLVWRDSMAGSGALATFYSHGSVAGSVADMALSPEQELCSSSSLGTASEPAAAEGKFGRFVVTWVASSTSVLVCSSDPTGSMWGETQLLHVVDRTVLTTAALYVASPRLVYLGGDDTMVVWESNDPLNHYNMSLGTDADVVFARSMDDLVTWTSPRPLNPGAEADSVDDTAPAVSLAGNTLVAVWSSANTLQATTGGDSDILVSRSWDKGESWVAPVPIVDAMFVDDVTALDQRPAIECSGISCVCTWTATDGDTDIQFTVTQDAGRSWAQPRYATPNSANTDTAGDDHSLVFSDSDGWLIGWITAPTGNNAVESVVFGAYSGTKFFSGDFENMVGVSRAEVTLTDFGRRFAVKANADAHRVGVYELLGATWDPLRGWMGEMDLQIEDRYVPTALHGIFEAISGGIFRLSFGTPTPSFIHRWDTTGTMYQFTDALGQVAPHLVVQGGNSATGYISTVGVYDPQGYSWEEVGCVGSQQLRRMAGHAMLSFASSTGDTVLLYGMPRDPTEAEILDGTALKGRLWEISNMRHVPHSQNFGRASGVCQEIVLQGDAPDWDRHHRVTVRNKLLIVSRAASADTIMMINTETRSWITIPGVTDPPDTAGPFASFINNAVVFVLSTTGGGVSLKRTDLDRINPNLCVATAFGGNFLVSALTGQRAVIDVTARSALGEPVSSGSDLTVELVSKSSSTRIKGKMEPQPIAAGVFRFVYTANAPDKYELRVQAFGFDIGDASSGHSSPFDVEVTPGATSLSSSELDVSFIAKIEAGKPSSFVINAKDAFGNPVLGGDDIKVTVVQGQDVTVATVKDNVDGTYTVSFNVVKAGAYTINALLGGVHLPGSPMVVSVDPGPPTASNSKVDGTNVTAGSSGKGATLSVQAVDSQGNPLTYGSGASHVKIRFFRAPTRRRVASTADLEEVPGTDISTRTTDNGDGTYSVSYFPFIDGNFVYQIEVGGEVVGEPVSLELKPVFVKPDTEAHVRLLLISVLIAAGLGAICNPSVLQRLTSCRKRKHNQEAITQASQNLRTLSFSEKHAADAKNRRRSVIDFLGPPTPEMAKDKDLSAVGWTTVQTKVGAFRKDVAPPPGVVPPPSSVPDLPYPANEPPLPVHANGMVVPVVDPTQIHPPAMAPPYQPQPQPQPQVMIEEAPVVQEGVPWDNAPQGGFIPKVGFASCGV